MKLKSWLLRLKKWKCLEYSLHESKELLLNLKLLLKLVLIDLNLCKCGICVLCLMSLILPHLLKNNKECWVYLWSSWRWSRS